jgi:5-hydroxyisourate hydrolase-like protein (transthyretin family)
MRKLSRTTLLTGALALAAASCGGDNGVTPPPPAAEVQATVIVEGDEQTLAAGAQSEPLVVEVLGDNDESMSGVTVTFTSSGVEHSLSDESVATDADGRAAVTVTAGTEDGEIEVQASAGNAEPATFSLTVEAAAEASALVEVSGDGQTINVDEESEPLVVEVRDQNEEPMEGVTVAFASSGVDHALSDGSATTDEDGRAAVTVTSEMEEGDIEVVAEVDGLDTVAFTLTVEFTAAPTTINKVSGDEQELEYNEESEALVVEVLDQMDDPMEGVTVAFTGSGRAHALSDEEATTDADGRAEVVVTAGTQPGEIEVEAAAEGTVPVVFTITVEDAPFSLEAPEASPRGLAWDGTHLWVAVGDDDQAPRIYQIDPADGSVENSFDAPAAQHRGLTWDGENLWYSAHGTRTIYKLDPSDGTVLDQFLSPRGNDSQPRGLAWDGETLWHADAGDPNDEGRMIFQLSPEDGEVLESFTSPVTLPVGLEWDGSHLWVSQIGGTPDLVRFDTEGNIVSSVPSPEGATIVGLALDEDGPWMWASENGEDEAGILIHRITVDLDDPDD